MYSCRDNVVQPLNNVRDEFFETFGSRPGHKMYSKADYEASKASLQRMLDSFEKDVARRDKKFNADEAGSNLEILMRHYEKELETPLRSAVTGVLPRTLLIQVRSKRH